ncbi:hypothetical protein EGW08_019231 [Elysia chlorotica]|uniref:Potassium channel domain-containing protein n=1 Tax=Elysia chlorotica TaxID=188477 RepID=A0A3S0ZQL6_ELYCH|nr:hypothetical protein EGW08_019231 [Elysia chlorotica]
MVPRTWGGQLFCIFYALFGIPIFGAVLVGTGERLQIPIKKLHQCKPWIKDNPMKDQKLKSITLLSTGMSVIVFIPAWVFTITEDWSYLEGMYYSVITLTTVGFGDLVPESIFTETGQGLKEFLIPKGVTATRHYFYRIVLSLWIIMGLSWIALILSEISTMMQSQMNNVAASTSHRLSNLEELVRKKAKETRQRFSKRDKTVHGQPNNVMVMSIAVASSPSEDDADIEFNESTNIVTTDDPGIERYNNSGDGGGDNNYRNYNNNRSSGGGGSELVGWTNANGCARFGDYNGHALPTTGELTHVEET